MIEMGATVALGLAFVGFVSAAFFFGRASAFRQVQDEWARRAPLTAGDRVTPSPAGEQSNGDR